MSTQNTLPTVELLENEGKVISSWSRWTGTGYSSFQAEWQGKVYQVDYNCLAFGEFFDRVSEIEDPRPARKAFAAEMREMSKTTGLSFETCLALGDESVVLANAFTIEMEKMVKTYVAGEAHELRCGISRRKAAIIKLIGGVEEINATINAMGQKNSTRVADELIRQIEASSAYAKAMRFEATDIDISMPASEIAEDGARTWSF